SIQNATATRKVILSASTIGSPEILLNSGIGNIADLKAVGIKPIVDLPDNTTAKAEDISFWQKTGQGFLVDSIASHLAFICLHDSDPIFKTNNDPSAGSHLPHYELLIANSLFLVNSPPYKNFLGIANAVVSPSSHGSVKLWSNNFFNAPLIDPGLLKSDFDKAVMRAA
ncbi:hypothetical protein C0993_006348, partial [Termitomyces sp. T159_Od127]